MRSNKPPRTPLFSLLIVALATVAVTLSTGTPSSVPQWIGLIIGAAISALATGDLVRRERQQAEKRSAPRPRTPPSQQLRAAIRHRAVAAGLAVAMLLVLTWVSAPRLEASAEKLDIWLHGCPYPTMLRVLATPDGIASARSLAAEFQRHNARKHDGCPSVRTHVFAVPPEAALEQLRNGWRSPDHGLYPRPDLWLPDSSWYLSNDLASATDELVSLSATRVALSPIVLAVPAAQAEQEVAGARVGRRWSELLDLAQESKWSVARPEPASSAVGLLATVALYTDAGKGDLTVDPSRARTVERRLADGLDHGHFSPGTGAELLCQQRRSADTATALIVSEQAMVRFNHGDPLGGRCAMPVDPVPAEQVLTAFYPKDTFALDYPVARLGWADASPAQAQAADEFIEWLNGPEARAALLAVGLRPQRTTISDPVNQRYGATSGLGPVPPSRPELPTQTTVDSVRQTQLEVARPTQVLLALDASGSMAQTVDGTNETRFTVAARGVHDALSRMGDRDQFQLWVFPDGDATVRRLVPNGPAGEPVAGVRRRDAVAAALSRVTPHGRTPLYQVVEQAIAEVGAGDETLASAVVILTDGQDQDAQLTDGRLKQQSRDRRVRVFVIAVGTASCAGQGLADIAEGSGGGCFDTAVDGMDQALTDLFESLWGGS